MKQNIIKFLQVSFPFFLTLALWRLSAPWINPAGILAIVPIFYCSFIRPVPYFAPFAILLCFLLDYKFNTVLLWTIFYCMFYVIMNLQTFIDLTHTNRDGIYPFMGFVGTAILFMVIPHLSLTNILSGILIFSILTIMYIPIITTIRAVQDD